MKITTKNRIIGAALVAVSLTACTDIDSGTGDSSLDDVTAYNACKGSVENQLRAPGTASFPDYYDHDGEVAISGTGATRTISSHVDAENGFGGEVRTIWTCTARQQDDGWFGTATLLG
jgi:hypothetical protein